MDAQFWLQRWEHGQTGFHRDAVMPLLEMHWPSLALAPDARVLVPLAGKSLDMLWLAARGHRVLGVELSPLAVQQFFRENNLHEEPDAPFNHHVSGNLDIVCGDVFELDAALLDGCSAVYDRAALIALPALMRRRYADRVYARLPTGARGLLITLDYPQADMDGPPFSVDAAEVHRLFAAQWDVQLLDRRDILASQPDFVARGISALHTAVYALQRRADLVGPVETSTP